MTVRLTKPSFNFRSKLNELDFGVVPYNKMPVGSCIQMKATDPVSDNTTYTTETTMLTLNFEPILSNSKLFIYKQVSFKWMATSNATCWLLLLNQRISRLPRSFVVMPTIKHLV